MKHLLLLLKVQALGFFGINRLFHEKKAKVKTFFIALGLLLLGLVFVSYSVMIAMGCAALGMARVVPSLMLLLCTMISFFAFITQSSGILFGFRDYELLMSLPIKKNVIVMSRLCSLYVLEFIFSLVFLLPALVVYGIIEGAAVLVWVMIFLSPLIVPLLPMTAAFIIAVALALVSRHFRHRNIVTVVLSVSFVIAVMVWSFSLSSSSSEEMISLITNLEGRIFRFYPVAVLYDLSIARGSGIHFLGFALLSCLPLALFTIILAKSYGRINSALSAVKINHRVHRDRTFGSLTQGTQRGSNIHGPFYAFYARELRQFGSSPVYMLNAGIGAVLLITAAISFLFTDMSAIEASFALPWFLSRTSFALPFFPAIFAAMTTSTSASISLEGKTRWLISSLPVKTGMIFVAKIALNLTIMVPSILIASPLFARALFLTGMSLAFVFITPLVYALLTAVLGLAINLRFPKYDWTTEQQAVKQSASVILSMLAGFAVVLLPVFLILAFPQYAKIVLVLATVIAALGAVLLYGKISSRRYYGFA
ncbi:hypothetical protein FACS189479_02840 [Spirochaetia bacterium]|nr:hypothetical protein FACS189479_02840 [Spirochaetia bacterium]